MEYGQREDHRSHPPSGASACAFRLRCADDDADIVTLYALQEPDSAPMTVARYRMEQAEQIADRQGEQWVAVDAGRVVGLGSFASAWWTGQRGSYTIHISVDQRRWRQGIGGELFRLLRARLSALEATLLLDWVRADAAQGRHFAAAQGFRETGAILEEYRLHVPEAITDPYAGLEGRLEGAGLRVASLAELGADDEPLLRGLQRLWAGVGDAPPDSARLAASFPSWQREVLDAAGASPETHWVALDGGCPVGMSFLKRLSEDAAENDYTCVAPAHRGRGIAVALKLRALAWARQQGVHWFYTSSEAGNAPMIAINERLGYLASARRVAVARDLS